MALRGLFDRRPRAEAEAAAPDSAERARLAALLDHLAGAGEGARALAALAAPDASVPEIAERLARTETFEFRCKEVRTRDIGVEGVREADAEYVGLAGMPPGLPFATQFSDWFRPRLGRRADGFAAIFDALGAPGRDHLIIETGCLRIPRNWDGDGQSSFLFDAFARAGGGGFFAIDITPEAIDTARRACSSATQLILNDSVAALHALARAAPGPASLLYLDSYDVQPGRTLPSAIHHAMELAAAGRLVGPGTIVCVDDYGFDAEGGKGMILDMFFAATRADVLYSGYQKVWRVR